jgi:hypothetical protein
MRIRTFLKRQAMLSKQIGAVNATWLRTHPLPRVVLTVSNSAAEGLI